MPPPQPIRGSQLPLTGEMFRLLNGIYERSDRECDVQISFDPGPVGNQQNPCRDLVVAYVGDPTVERGRVIAERLAEYTDHRPKLGLMFLIVGRDGQDYKVIISRFPADNGILAEENAAGLNVEYVERVFMKNAKSYKAALYRHRSLTDDFWDGAVIDRQVNDADVNVSGYWITDFLASGYKTTSGAGTRRLALAFRDAARKAESATLKSEIVAAATLARGQHGQHLSARGFTEALRLPEEVSRAILAEVKPQVVNEAFQFSAEEFSRHVAYRSVELDNGGVMTAEATEFDRVFASEVVDQVEGTMRFSTEGVVVREKLNKALR